MIRCIIQDDFPAICNIYNYYVLHTTITFEETAVDIAAMEQRVTKVQQAGLPWLVAEEEGNIVGYAYASPWRERSAYRFSVESSVYLHPERTGNGIGTQLYAALLEQLRTKDIHCVMGGIALPNPASVAISEKFGFRKVAHFQQVGWKQNRWIDVGYWQLLLHTTTSPQP